MGKENVGVKVLLSSVIGKKVIITSNVRINARCAEMIEIRIV